MSASKYGLHYSNPRTTASPKGGCLSGFLLPPLAVIIVGTILAVVLLNVSPATPDVKAAGLSQSRSTAQTSLSNIPEPPANFISGKPGDISPIFMPEVQYWSGEIRAWATQTGLDSNLIATVMQIESCGYQKAISRAGAIGLFQVMPFHFVSGDNPYDPDTNAARGLAYLKRSLQAAGGDIRLALAGYNGGIGVIGQPESNWSGQTRGYVAAGNRIYAEASKTDITTADVQQWTSEVTALCQQAAADEGINP